MAYQAPDETAVVVNLIECSLELKVRKDGGVYISCRDVRCKGKCRLYIVDQPETATIGCECVGGHGTCELVREDRLKGGHYVSCASKDCTGTCLLFYIGPAAKEIGCECV